MPLLAIETTCDETAAAVITPQPRGALERGRQPGAAPRAVAGRRARGGVAGPRRADHSRDRRGGGAGRHRAARPRGRGRGREARARRLAARRPLGRQGDRRGARHSRSWATTTSLAHLYACRLAHPEPWSRSLRRARGQRRPHVAVPRRGRRSTLERLGGTIDDAAGEAFDKAASLLGLGYPGGPQIERAAVGGNPRAHRLPRPLATDRDRLDLSFSGLKTALRYLVRPPGRPAGHAASDGPAACRPRRVVSAGRRRFDPRQGRTRPRPHRLPRAARSAGA